MSGIAEGRVVIVTGAARGIGRGHALEFARQGAKVVVNDLGAEVDGTGSSGAAAEVVAEIEAMGGEAIVNGEDVSDFDGAKRLIDAAVERFGDLHVLVNNAGILRENASRDDFTESFLVNAVAPFEVTRSLLPRLKLSANPRVVSLTSRMGSLTDNTSGGHYAYRASKAALNMINRSLALDHPWLTAIVVHPGWVRTRMGGTSAPVESADSAAGIWRLAKGLAREHSGRFYDYLGNELPW